MYADLLVRCSCYLHIYIVGVRSTRHPLSIPLIRSAVAATHPDQTVRRPIMMQKQTITHS